jgi:hypothetical protein
MSAPKEILSLVERFGDNLEAHLSSQYNETQLRREFLDPFFKALGWDIDNEQGFAEAYKDVIHEDAIRVGRAVKAPDYCFRIGGTRKFFLEAKKPSVSVKEDADPAYQLRRYAWSAKLSLSILSDFEEFAVYDCRVKPHKDDGAATARIFYCTFSEYANKWDWLTGNFSREAVLKGAFDRFSESTRAKKGTAEVDEAFLQEIESWRRELAQHLALRNARLTQRELNFAVQRIIDRIIFLRICEDRGIEDYGRLRTLLNGERVYPRLCQLFQQADDRYNSGLFHFKREKDRHEPPDELTLDLVVDDKPLKDILRSLYYPDSPYEFSVLSADILGHVYEQFLGKVIRLTGGHRAVVEDKPEVKKTGGVYYTPTFIVDYIVRQTVGKLIEGKTPRQATTLRVLDPACGSGSFLIGAYQCLLDWHRDWYTENDPAKWARGSKATLHQASGGGWKLTIAERKRILLNSIFGVDIDPQAVEVTKLSLLLKVLEAENEQTLQPFFRFFHERALPDLGDNIKCGNSLIGPDFYQQQQMSLLGDEQRYRINVFDWHAEFPGVFRAGGFDAVIGNPPWGALLTEPELEYLRQRNREIIVRMIDSFMYFIHQGSGKLNLHGYFGMILPDVILYQTDNEKLREFILSQFKIHCILNMGDVFHKVTRPACILVLQRGQSPKQVIETADLCEVPKPDKPTEVWNESRFVSLAQGKIRDVPGSLFITSNLTQYAIWTKVRSRPHRKLQDLVDEDGIQRGVSPDLKEAFLIDNKTVKKARLEPHKLRTALTGGKHVKRYFIERPDLWLIYTSRDDNFRELPNIRAYIDQFKSRITCKEVKQHKHPLYALHRARDERIFLKKQKLLGVITEDEIVLALDEEQTFATDGLYLFGIRETTDLKYVMGILNSKLFVFVYRLLALEAGRVLAQVKPTVLAQLPIRLISFSDRTEKARHDRLVKLVEQMLALRRQQSAARTPQEQTALSRQIAATDAEINRLVYELYDLTEDEIKIVQTGSA